MSVTNPNTIYKITIQGHLREKWAEWFNAAIIEIVYPAEDTNTTTLTVAVPDQAALRGVVNKLWDLNLTLISLTLEIKDKIGGING
jgi:hypothetical protein